MRAGNLSLIGVLLAGTMAWAAGDSEALNWKQYNQENGGLQSTAQGYTEINRAQLDKVPMDGSPDRLDAFMNAYYLCYDKGTVGGLGCKDPSAKKDNRLPSLDFAAELTTGSNPKVAVQAYQTVFWDHFSLMYKAWKTKEQDDEKAFQNALRDAKAAAKQVALDPRADIWRVSMSDLKTEVRDWMLRPDSRYGYGKIQELMGMQHMTLEQATKAAGEAADKLSAGLSAAAARSMESTNRQTTNRFVAFRDMYYFAAATAPGGGLGMSWGDAFELARTLIAADDPPTAVHPIFKDNAVVRVELLKTYYRRYLLTKNQGDADLPKFKQLMLGQAQADAAGAKIEPDVNGGVKITPAAGAAQ
jgi:hypothetical protein